MARLTRQSVRRRKNCLSPLIVLQRKLFPHVSQSRKRKQKRPPATTAPGRKPSKQPGSAAHETTTGTPRDKAAGLRILLVIACFAVGIGGGLALRSLRQSPQETGVAADESAEGSQATHGTAAETDAADHDPPTTAPPTTAAVTTSGSNAAPAASATAVNSAASASPTVPKHPPADAAARQAIERRFGALFRRGYESFHAERYAEAAEHFQQAVQVAPYLGEGHFYLGEVYRKMAFANKAETCYRLALERLPDFPEAERQLCILLYERGAYDEAITLLEQRLRNQPDDTFALGELAVNFMALGQPDRAVPLLEQFNELSGKQAWGYAHLGRAFDLQQQPEPAEQWYRDAISIDPYLDVGHYWLGLLLVRQGRQQESREPLARYDQLRKLQNSEHSLQMALLRDATDVTMLIRLAQTRHALGKRKEAIETLQRAERLAPNHPEILRTFRAWNSGTGSRN